jgi:hypothetical protein
MDFGFVKKEIRFKSTDGKLSEASGAGGKT